jgi:hypothetical protein
MIANNGNIGIRPTNCTSDTSVTLTATISYGGASDAKDLAVTVKKYTPDENIEMDKNALTITYGTADATCNPQVETCVTKDVTLPTTGTYCSSVSWATSDSFHMNATGAVKKGYKLCSVEPGPFGYSAVTMTATISRTGGVSQQKTFSPRVYRTGCITISDGTLVLTKSVDGGMNFVAVAWINATASDAATLNYAINWSTNPNFSTTAEVIANRLLFTQGNTTSPQMTTPLGNSTYYFNVLVYVATESTGAGTYMYPFTKQGPLVVP